MKRAAVAACMAPFRGQDPSLDPLAADGSAQEPTPKHHHDGLATILQAVPVCSAAPGALMSSLQPSPPPSRNFTWKWLSEVTAPGLD